jgi:phosphatidylcholine synthase
VSETVAPGRRVLALGVHIFTATGVIWGFLAMLAIIGGDVRGMFLWLAVAFFVDGIDGTIARRLDIHRAAPRWSGEALDLVVDYLTYVFVPTYALVQSGLIPGAAGIVAALIILMTSAMYFADNEMKTEDAWFKGFPAVWNLVVFYFFLLDPSPAVTFLAVAALGLLTFAPIVFVHPLRVAKLRPVTLSLLLLWSILALYAIWRDMVPEPFVVWALSAIAVYFLVLGYFRATPPRPPGS